MIQLEFDLEWLKDDWQPSRIKTYRGKEEMSDDAFDDEWSQSMGYESYADMIAQENKKHHRKVNEFGDRYIQGWLK